MSAEKFFSETLHQENCCISQTRVPKHLPACVVRLTSLHISVKVTLNRGGFVMQDMEIYSGHVFLSPVSVFFCSGM